RSWRRYRAWRAVPAPAPAGRATGSWSTQVRREQHDAGLRIERAGRADPHAGDLLTAGLRHGRPRELDDALHDGVGALLGDRRLGDEPQQLRAVLGHRAGDDVGPADVNSDDVAHRSPRWRAARPRP